MSDIPYVSSQVILPRNLSFLWEQLPLVHAEKPEDYFSILYAIAADTKPTRTIEWIYLKSVTDLTWEIIRERTVKAGIIKSKQEEVIREPMKKLYKGIQTSDYVLRQAEFAREETEVWAKDHKQQKEITARLAEKGYSSQDVIVRAYSKALNEIAAADQRLATLETLRMRTLREFERYNKSIAKDLGDASTQIIDGEFSEADE